MFLCLDLMLILFIINAIYVYIYMLNVYHTKIRNYTGTCKNAFYSEGYSLALQKQTHFKEALFVPFDSENTLSDI